MWLRRSAQRSNGLVAVVGEGCELEGRCHFTGVAMIEGRVTGESVTADQLIIGATGSVAGVVTATLVVVRGTVKGNIVARERVDLAATARVEGDIQAPTLAMEAGAVVEGHCRISPTRAEEPEREEPHAVPTRVWALAR
jgi:cytoskeletal protein CcmA (bactofilin family)